MILRHYTHTHTHTQSMSILGTALFLIACLLAGSKDGTQTGARPSLRIRDVNKNESSTQSTLLPRVARSQAAADCYFPLLPAASTCWSWQAHATCVLFIYVLVLLRAVYFPPPPVCMWELDGAAQAWRTKSSPSVIPCVYFTSAL